MLKLKGYAKLNSSFTTPIINEKGDIIHMFFENFFKRYKIDVGITAAFLCAVLLPLFIIAHFNYPCSDDFWFGSALYKGIRENSGLGTVVEGAWNEAMHYYREWQGCYFGNVILTFGIGIAIPRYYFLGTYLILVLWTIGTIALLRMATYQIGGWDSDISWIVSMLIMAMQALYVPYPPEAFYWYVGASAYTLPYALLLFFCTVLNRYYLNDGKKKRIFYGICAVLLAFMIGGSNYTTGLLTAELLVLTFLWRILRKKRCRFLGIVMIEYFICFVCFNVLAKGNQARAASMNGMGAIESIFASFEQGFRFLRDWFQPSVIFLMIVIFLLGGYQMAKADCSFKMPAAVTLLSFGVFCSQMTPPFFAGASYGPGRLTNLVYFSYYFLLAGNLLYWMGWAAKRFEGVRRYFWRKPKTLAILLGFFVLWTGWLKIAGLQSTCSSSAFLSLVKGEASTYLKEHEVRWAFYEDDAISDVVVEKLSVKPRVLYFTDITEDTTDERNRAVAGFFSKNSVRSK